ncbi:MAG: family 14 glycosylhydrolase, partial [Gemmatimonadales bacterium]|nr:family 14 glycosylhydrolase [Gemmatimonadales bacterium]
GEKIGRTYVGLVGPYGEGNYPLPISDWLNIGHCHEGYWCGDEYARRAFVQNFKERYQTLERLNEAWGTRFAKWEDVDFPPEIAAG